MTHWHTEQVRPEPDTASWDTAMLTKCPMSLVWVRRQMSNAGGNVLHFCRLRNAGCLKHKFAFSVMHNSVLGNICPVWSDAFDRYYRLISHLFFTFPGDKTTIQTLQTLYTEDTLLVNIHQPIFYTCFPCSQGCTFLKPLLTVTGQRWIAL